jgi:hypothetical protein
VRIDHKHEFRQGALATRSFLTLRLTSLLVLAASVILTLTISNTASACAQRL